MPALAKVGGCWMVENSCRARQSAEAVRVELPNPFSVLAPQVKLLARRDDPPQDRDAPTRLNLGQIADIRYQTIMEL
jgi:hypothetical protein